ncbi:MAG: TIGR02757 family protein [Helicobacteraceae bacterium]|nr:TIGR02757 family protein [Helicobacteraceae bacterium]
MIGLKKRLDQEVSKRNSSEELSEDRLDPIMVAREYKDEYISLICALFAYGNAKQIVKFLRSLDFSLLDASDEVIKKELASHYYRFQTPSDVIELFLVLKKFKQEHSIEELFYSEYKKENNVIEGVNKVINTINTYSSLSTHGFNFLVGSEVKKYKGSSALKRWMMYLRWMVRKDEIDFGLWSKVDKKDLILPLDTHTFKVSQKLGLLDRKSYDMYSAMLITEKLREFDIADPIKYDFALYRLGQEKII